MSQHTGDWLCVASVVAIGLCCIANRMIQHRLAQLRDRKFAAAWHALNNPAPPIPKRGRHARTPTYRRAVRR